MFGKKKAIKKYVKKLPGELSHRYGSGPYTQAQVKKTVEDLGFSREYIQFAYLLFCEREVLSEEGVSDKEVEEMREVSSKAAGAGVAGLVSGALVNAGFGDGGSLGAGVGGGGDGVDGVDGGGGGGSS